MSNFIVYQCLCFFNTAFTWIAWHGKWDTRQKKQNYTVNSLITWIRNCIRLPCALRQKVASPLSHCIAYGLIYTFNSIQNMQKDSFPFYAQWFSWKGITWKLSSAVKLKHAHSFRIFFPSLISSGILSCLLYTMCIYFLAVAMDTQAHITIAKRYSTFISNSSVRCTLFFFHCPERFLLSHSCDAVI